MKLDTWIRYCENLRNNVIKKENGENKYLLTNFSGTEQKKDIEARTPLINDFCRVKINVKAFSDEERAKKGLEPFDFHNEQDIFNALKEEFDMPYWALLSIAKPLKDLTKTFIYQLKACNIHCPWCYVDDISKNAQNSNNSSFFSVREIMDMFEKEQKNQPLYNFRPSGGEPTLAVEQWLESLREIEKRNLTAFIQGDTNLTTGCYIEHLENTGQIEKNLLEKIGEYDNFGLLCSFKGTDKESFLKSIGMPEQFSFLEDERWHTFGKLVKAGIDAYIFVYGANPKTLEPFMKKGAGMFGDGFYLKTWIVKLKLYGAEKPRLDRIGVNSDAYQKELDENFQKSEEIMQNLIWKKFGINYQAFPRTGFKLKVK